MYERIRELAQLLNIEGGGLARLARDIAHDSTLRDVEYMTKADAEELLRFLEKAAAHTETVVFSFV